MIEGCRNPTPTLNAPITTTTIASGSTSIPYGEKFSGTEQVIAPLAVADGKLVFHNADTTGWGNALLLAFRSGNQPYIAVYAHLPASAKTLDGKQVTVGAGLGQAGCTGVAGNGNGKCNDDCDVGPQRSTDIHVHFELLTKQNGLVVSIDPQSVIGFSVDKDTTKRLYTITT
jgi:hypothetical protein